MKNPTNRELAILIETGFKHVNDHLKELNHGQKENTEYRLKSQGSIGTWQFIISVTGLGTIIALFKTFL